MESMKSLEYLYFHANQAQMSAAMQAKYLRLWAQTNMSTEMGQPLDFTGRPWLKDLWDDLHPHIVVQKAAQVGITTWAIAKALHQAGVPGKTVIFTLPTEEDIQDFVSGRLDKIIDLSPQLQQLAGRTGVVGRRRPVDNTEVKHVGRGSIYFRGTQSERAALSVPAHVLIHDEVDRSQPEKLEMYAHRLDALPPGERQIYLASTPTVAGYGVSAHYDASDAKQWLVRCTGPGCDWWGQLDYYEHTEGHLNYLRCSNCGTPLDPLNGEWVAQHPDRSSRVHGYQISRLMLALPGRTDVLEDLHARRESARYKRHFENMDLGIVSSEGASSVSREQILGACFVEGYTIEMGPMLGAAPYYMGVDQGDTLTVLVGRSDAQRDGGRLRVLYMGQLRDPQRGSGAWQEVARLMQAFRVRMCVVDANPNSASAHDLARQFPGRVLTCYYKEGQRAEVVEASDVRRRAEEGQGGQLPKTERVDITVERTETLDRTVEELIGGRVLLPGPHTRPEVEEFMRHCTNNVRRAEEDKDGMPTYRWVRTGPNDYFHALNYLRLAKEENDRLSALNPVILAPVVVHGVPQRASSRRSRW